MMNSWSFTRRQALAVGVGGLVSSSLSPVLALATDGEDPAAIITDLANDAFDLFGSLNGVSGDWTSRRTWYMGSGWQGGGHGGGHGMHGAGICGGHGL